MAVGVACWRGFQAWTATLLGSWEWQVLLRFRRGIGRESVDEDSRCTAHPLGTHPPRVAAHFLYAERKDWEFAVLGEIRAVDCGTASRCRAHRGSRRGGPDIVEEGQGGIVN